MAFLTYIRTGHYIVQILVEMWNEKSMKHLHQTSLLWTWHHATLH